MARLLDSAGSGLPGNVTWDDFLGGGPYVYPAHSPLLPLVPPAAACFAALQHLTERYILPPIGVFLGVPDWTREKTTKNEILEKAYKSTPKPTAFEVTGLAKQLDWSEEEVERWLRQRGLQDAPSSLKKFANSGWRCLYYTYSFLFGVAVLWDKSWLWDIRECWVGYPLKQSLPPDIFWYYLSSISFYSALSVSQCFKERGKGFWPLFVHHIATVVLLSMSWEYSLYRIGSLVVFVHDVADIFLEGSKMAKYAGWERTVNVIFAFFLVAWVFTRIWLFPFWIIHSALVTAPELHGWFPVLRVGSTLLVILFMLHILWTIQIFRIFYKIVFLGQKADEEDAAMSE